MNYKHPNFFIIGAAKSGTSSLYNYLIQHPQIFMSPIKEPHFFSYQEKFLYSNGPGDRKRMMGSTPDLNSYLQLFEGAKNEGCIGEASTTYLDSLEAPHRIKDFNPSAKIILILRNPVDRAYASFMHLRRDGTEKFSVFETALEQEKKRIENKWCFLWHYKTRQLTYRKLKRYYDIFPKEKMKIYEYENWKSNNLNMMKDIFSFLEIDEKIVPSVAKKYNVGGTPKNLFVHNFFTNKNSFKEFLKIIIPNYYRNLIRNKIFKLNLERIALSYETRIALINFFRDDIKKVEELIQIDLSKWLVCD